MIKHFTTTSAAILSTIAFCPPAGADPTTDKLVAGEEGQIACDYFEQKGVTEETLFKFVNVTAAFWKLTGEQVADFTMDSIMLYCPDQYGPVMKVVENYAAAHGPDSGQGGKSSGKLNQAR